MTNKKKIVIIVLVAAILLGCVATAIILFGKESAGLPELEATSEDVVLGTAYETATTITDKNGREYTVENTEVYRKSDGKQVTLIYGMFDVDNLLGYEIVYTVTAGDYTATQTHTLNVVDEGKPRFSVEAKHVAEVGVKYTFPAITVRDNSKAEIPYTITVYRSGENLQEAPQEADGFIPTEVGYYELHIRAEDASGNVTEEVYKVYARHTRTATEVDGFDDEGLYYSSYAKSGTKKQQAGFSAFRRLTTSKGSAYFMAGSGTNTEFYVQPRNDGSIMDNLGTDGYISVWMYISTLRDSKKTVYVGSTSREVLTNSWQELKITADMVDMWKAYFSKLETYSVPLLSVVNDGEDYVCFIDDIYAISAKKSTVEKSTLKAGEQLDVTLTSIINDPSKPGQGKLLVFTLNGDISSGQNVTLSVGERSANFDSVIPNSALRTDTNGTFVLVLTVKHSPLGNRYIATRVDVNVLAQDDTTAAVSGLSMGDYVITTSSKPLEAGMQVNMVEN